jgi:hypothetical protein
MAPEQSLAVHRTLLKIIQFLIYAPSQQLQGLLQTQHSVDTSNYIMGKQYKIKV